MKAGTLWMCGALALALCASCATRNEFGEREELTVDSLSREQKSALRSASAQGEHELITTASRMAWDSPRLAADIAEYAAVLKPESEEQIYSAVRMAVSPQRAR